MDLPSSIPVPIQEDGASGVLETQPLPTLGIGQEGWTPHQTAGWGLGALSWAICIFSNGSAR